MTVSVKPATRNEVEQFIRNSDVPPEHIRIFFQCFRATTEYWMGALDGETICIWGIIPPTLLSDNVYLWLYTTPDLEGNEFVFVRHSQRAVEEILRSYPRIIGHATVGADRSIRWLRWLGAKFGEPDGGLIPFTITENKMQRRKRRRHG